MNAIIQITDAMRELGIRQIRYRPADDLIPRDGFTVQLMDGWLATHIGMGATVGEAFEDAVAKVRGKEAA